MAVDPDLTVQQRRSPSFRHDVRNGGGRAFIPVKTDHQKHHRRSDPEPAQCRTSPLRQRARNDGSARSQGAIEPLHFLQGRPAGLTLLQMGLDLRGFHLGEPAIMILLQPLR